ncbi:unnamed protein product [Adineta steineri]|uniref:Endonuclease/exonuclease/phosphatase domain-containing protein n=1 Tax=Adineta steineri TaxID=433720 RepID=A0A818Y4C3_9BILA|nr:unnamed protein product [Adineta steineri]CAF3745352.1 unnamed protein product [Adineta steineri]
MATPKNCSKCTKGKGSFFCIGCEEYFCKKDYGDHRAMMDNELDRFIEDCNTLQEKINTITQNKNFDSLLLTEIDNWEKTIIDKVKKVAEQVREQFIKLASAKEMETKSKFEKYRQNLNQLKETGDFVEHDLKYLELTVYQLNQDLKRLNQPLEFELSQHPQTLPIWHYDVGKHQWRADDPATTHHHIKPKVQRFLRAITYNISFSKEHKQLRFQGLSSILQHSKADIICLQEMTKSILEQLISEPWVQQHYFVSDIDGSTFLNGQESYGVVMLIGKSLYLRRLLAFPFHTEQGRQLLLAEIQLKTEKLLVGTVHLESKQDKETIRSHQIQTCQSVFNKYAMNQPNVTRLLMGDFSMDAVGPENLKQMNILKNWTDLWEKLNGANNRGWTYINARVDRIMFQSLRTIPIKIRMIGMTPIGQAPKRKSFAQTISSIFSLDKKNQDMTQIFPSDHFGLMADFDLSRI